MTQTPASLVKGRGTGDSRWWDSFSVKFDLIVCSGPSGTPVPTNLIVCIIFSMKRAIILHATSSASHTLGTFPVQGKVSCAVLVFRIRSIDYIKPHLINCRDKLLQTFPSGGRGTALAVDEVSPLLPDRMSANKQTPASLVKGRGTGDRRWWDSLTMEFDQIARLLNPPVRLFA